MIRTRSKAFRPAFTLLEVIIALALGTALLGAMFGFLFNVMNMRRGAVDFAVRQRTANVLFEMLDRQLTTALVGSDASGPGIAGDTNSLRLLVRGVDVALAGRKGLGREAIDDRSIMEYRFDDNRGVIEARRSFTAPSNAPAGEFEAIGEGIYRVRFRYHDGQAWRDSFDSLEVDRLPRAVEVAIWFDPWPGAEDAADDAASADQTSRRETFDDTSLASDFNERSFAFSSDAPTEGEPKPDRRCVIAITDAGGEATP